MHRKVLRTKLWRDMRGSGMQFAALVLLCVLGTFLFSGIDGVAQMTEVTNSRYFAENKLSHFWITLPAADRQALAAVRGISGVETVCARFSQDMETTLPGEPTLNVTAYNGAMTVNVPIVEAGSALDPSDRRGCLVQAGFARAHGLSVGDRITVRREEREYAFQIRGIIYSPEFISVLNDVAADPNRYGFVLVNAGAFAQLPLNQLVVRLSPGANAENVRRTIARLLPSAFIVDRDTHRSTALAQDNVTMFRSLSIVFPLAAFIVAALIVATTLTRMIDNQRMQIGTLRSLGYTDGQIKRHYLSYAIWPSLVGSVAGALLGRLTLPGLVWRLLIGQNEYPYRMEPPITTASWIMAGVSVAMSVIICMVTYRKAARETAAALLRPKPPKAGRRNLLERVKPFWRRLGFNGKMVIRNLARNKMRTMMSCVGVLCCNVLIIASMGLQDSVVFTAHQHYGGVLGYDLRAELDDGAGEASAYQRRLDADTVECVMEISIRASHGDQGRTTLLTVIQDDQRLLRLGNGQTNEPLAANAITLTRKLAKTLGVGAGDTLTFQFPGDEDALSLPIDRLVTSHFSQGAYMNRTTYEALRKGTFVPTAILLQNPSARCVGELEAMSEVERVDDIRRQASDALISLDMVSSIFSLLTVIALALAFVICYNMGLMNFAERTREYATLKVLGYHQKEIRRLILSENRIITVCAILLSIIPGIAFTDVILAMCETDTVRYMSRVAPLSIAISCAVTYAFSVFIQRLLARKVRGIVMVEALKSVE